MEEKCYSAIMGGIVADAIGVPFEFRSPNEMVFNPCIDMIGHGTYNKPSGTWSDDSSMTLATMDALIDGNFDLNKIMLNFLDWLTSGKYTQDGFMFDIGTTTREALDNYKNNLNTQICGQKDEFSNGNGALMRIMPVALYIFSKGKTSLVNDSKMIQLVNDISGLTHAHIISKEACLIYVNVALHLLNEEGKQGILDALLEIKPIITSKCFDRLFDKDFFKMDKKELTGKGYVVNTLEDSLYIAYNTNSYKEGVLFAVNMGDDTDTTASVTGGLLGLMYGYNAIGFEWIEGIRNRQIAFDIIDKFIKNMA